MRRGEMLDAALPPLRGLVARGPGRAGAELVAEVVREELLRRLAPRGRVEIGADVSFGHQDGSAAPGASAEVDFVVVTRPAESPAAAQSAAPVLVLGGAADEGPLASPSLLAGRHYERSLVQARVDWLRLSGVLPATGPVLLLAVGRDPRPDDLDLAEVQRFAKQQALALLVVTDPGPGFGPEAGPDGGPEAEGARGPEGEAASTPVGGYALLAGTTLDLVAAASASALVVSDDPVVVDLAIGLGRPAVAVASGAVASEATGGHGRRSGITVIERLELLGEALGTEGSAGADRMGRYGATEALDLALDRLAATISALPPTRRTTPATWEELAGRVRMLERVRDGLSGRLRAERLAFGRLAGSMVAPAADDDRQRLWVLAVEADSRAAAAEARARSEIEEAERETERAHLAELRAGGATTAAAAALGAREVELRRLGAVVEQLRDDVQRAHLLIEQRGDELRQARDELEALHRSKVARWAARISRLGGALGPRRTV